MDFFKKHTSCIRHSQSVDTHTNKADDYLGAYKKKHDFGQHDSRASLVRSFSIIAKIGFPPFWIENSNIYVDG